MAERDTLDTQTHQTSHDIRHRRSHARCTAPASARPDCPSRLHLRRLSAARRTWMVSTLPYPAVSTLYAGRSTNLLQESLQPVARQSLSRESAVWGVRPPLYSSLPLSHCSTAGCLRLLQELVGHHKLTDEEKEKMETFEGLDYDVVENTYHQKAAIESTPRTKQLLELSKWALTFAIGVSTGLCAFVVKLGVERLAELRFRTTLDLITEGSHVKAFGVFGGLAALYVLVAAVLVAYIEPVACGSGIPEMKGYLNGAK